MVVTNFCALITAFVFIVATMLIPSLRRIAGFPTVIVAAIAFFILGVTLAITALKKIAEGKLRKFLILTGSSAAGFLVSVLLHNFLYGLAVVTENIPLLHYSAETLSIIFFFVSIILCPLGFLVGVVGSIILLAQQKKIV
ncbi:hypothetical protein KKB83_00960 [Patescibacteria group bacterium]|nr:hypothetical protein [Patescibacteria group bacterium]